MIPRKLHYCWLSEDPFPSGIQACMETWKRFLPEFEWVLWNQQRFQDTDVSIVEAAIAARKWAFASDFIRLHALYQEGGLYLDSDVYLRKPIEGLLQGRLVSAIEYHRNLYPGDHLERNQELDAEQVPLDRTQIFRGLGVQAAFIASEPGHPFIKRALDYYRELNFSAHGDFSPHYLAPEILAHVMMEFGLRYADEEQHLREGIHLYPSAIIAPSPALSSGRSAAIHYCAGGWHTPDSEIHRAGLLQRIKGFTIVRKMLRRPPRLGF